MGSSGIQRVTIQEMYVSLDTICMFKLGSEWDPAGSRFYDSSFVSCQRNHGHGPSWGLEIHNSFILHVWLRRFVQERFYSFACSLKILVMTDAVASFAPAGTRDGEFPPWVVAKAIAYHVVLSDVSQFLETSASDLVGMRVDDYIAGKVKYEEGLTNHTSASSSQANPEEHS